MPVKPYESLLPIYQANQTIKSRIFNRKFVEKVRVNNGPVQFVLNPDSLLESLQVKAAKKSGGDKGKPLKRNESEKISDISEEDWKDRKKFAGLFPKIRVYSNNDVYEHKYLDPSSGPNYRELPKCIYLTYMDFDESHNLHVRHFYYEHTDPIHYGDEVEFLIDEMTKAVMSDLYAAEDQFVGEDNQEEQEISLPPPLDTLMSGLRNTREVNFDKMRFREKCYVAFVVKAPNWRFHSNKTGESSVQFVVYDETETSFSDNTSFFDAKNFNVDLSGGGSGTFLPGFYMINHYLGADGEPADETNIGKFKFDIFMLVKFGIPGWGDSEKTIVIDPTGNNGGPPGGGND